MKKKILSIVALIFVAIFALQVIALAAQSSGISPLNNNVLSSFTDFSISKTGNSKVDVNYTGYPNVTTGATITVTIKKNTFLFFWSEVVNETYVVVGEKYRNTYNYDLSSHGPGKYRCNVTYTISGSGGADDVIPFEKDASY